MKSTKILVYTENYLPSIGGLENNTELLCNSMVSLGFVVTLVTPQKNAKKSEEFSVVEIKSAREIAVYVKRSAFLIVNGGVAFKAILPAVFYLKPFYIIYQMATLYKDIRNNDLKTRVLNILRKLTASLSKKNIGVSEYSYQQLKAVFGIKSGLLINPADPLFFNQKQHIYQNPLQCLVAGRLIEGKGIKLLIDAVKEVNVENEKVHLHIVGDGPERAYVENETKQSFIFYHKPMNKEALKDFFTRINLTIVPSTTHIEGSPLIMAESLVMGVPVLVSSQPAMVASIKYKGLIFESGDLKNLVEKLLFLTDEVNYNFAKTEANKLAETYSYTGYCQNLKSIFNV